MIKINFFLLASFFVFSSFCFAEIVYQFNDPVQEKRFYSLISEIRCPKCTSGSIASSDAPVSRDLKNKVYELVIEGSSDVEIKNVLFNKSHGEDALNIVESEFLVSNSTFKNIFLINLKKHY